MWQYQNTDELYHYGRLGMRWGYHIFGDDYKYRSRDQKKVSKQLKKLGKSGANKSNSSDYNKLRNKLKRLKKRDNKILSSYKKEVAKKRAINAIKKQAEKTEKKIKKQGTKNLTDNELRKQIQRLQLENQYTNLKRTYDRNKIAAGKSKSNNVLDRIGKSVLEPSLINSSKNIITDLLTKLGKSTNTAIEQGYQNLFKDIFGTDYSKDYSNKGNNYNKPKNNYKKKKRY